MNLSPSTYNPTFQPTSKYPHFAFPQHVHTSSEIAKLRDSAANSINFIQLPTFTLQQHENMPEIAKIQNLANEKMQQNCILLPAIKESPDSSHSLNSEFSDPQYVNFPPFQKIFSIQRDLTLEREQKMPKEVAEVNITQEDALESSSAHKKPVTKTNPITIAVGMTFVLPLQARKNDIVNIKVEFKTDKINLTNMCDSCGRKIIQKSHKSKLIWANEPAYKFLCNPVHKTGRRPSEHKPNITLHVETNDTMFLIPFFLYSRRNKRNK